MHHSSNQNHKQQPSDQHSVKNSTEETSDNYPSKVITLSDEDLAKQEEYRRAYLEQLRRQSCPGCGDDGSIPF